MKFERLDERAMACNLTAGDNLSLGLEVNHQTDSGNWVEMKAGARDADNPMTGGDVVHCGPSWTIDYGDGYKAPRNSLQLDNVQEHNYDRGGDYVITLEAWGVGAEDNVHRMQINHHVDEPLVGDIADGRYYDNRFDNNDLKLLFQSGKFETDEPATRNQGDFNNDGVFTTRDLVFAFIHGDYQTTPA